MPIHPMPTYYTFIIYYHIELFIYLSCPKENLSRNATMGNNYKKKLTNSISLGKK